jgi:hypothetical protein
MAAQSSEDPLASLNRLVRSAISLASQLEAITTAISQSKNAASNATLSNAAEGSPSPLPPSSSSQLPDALNLARDSALLIKAHATKISLFIINEPYTPTAISKVLQELVRGPIPALASAAQLCDAARYTVLVRTRLAWCCSAVLREVRGLLGQIPADGVVLQGVKKDGNGSARGAGGKAGKKGSIATTGVIWAACDEVVSLATLGVGGSVVAKVDESRATLKDVLEELKGWSEEQDEEADEAEEESKSRTINGADAAVEETTNGLAKAHISAQAMVDDLMDASQRIPRGDPDRIRDRLDSCLRRLRLTTLLYQAAIKRRLKQLPPLPAALTETDSAIGARLNEVLPLLARLPERFTSLALAFYDLDAAEIDKLMGQCFTDCFAASELLAAPWIPRPDGQKDEFGEWVVKFQAEIKRE